MEREKERERTRESERERGRESERERGGEKYKTYPPVLYPTQVIKIVFGDHEGCQVGSIRRTEDDGE